MFIPVLCSLDKKTIRNTTTILITSDNKHGLHVKKWYNDKETRAQVIKVLQLIQHNRIQGTIQFIAPEAAGTPFPALTAPLLLKPVGRECHPDCLSRDDMTKAISAVGKVLASLHDIDWCHCDVRWPNVILDVTKNEFVLIDFEYARKVGQPCPNIKDEYIHPKIKETGEWNIFGDTHQLAMMVKRWMDVTSNADAHSQNLLESLQALAKKQGGTE